MNLKHAKSLRRALRDILGKDWREHKYQWRGVSSRKYCHLVQVDTGEKDEQGFTIYKEEKKWEALQVRLNPACGRAAYRMSKRHVHAA